MAARGVCRSAASLHPCGVVRLRELVPNPVEDSEGDGKAEAEDPGEIPHARNLGAVCGQ